MNATFGSLSQTWCDDSNYNMLHSDSSLNDLDLHVRSQGSEIANILHILKHSHKVFYLFA